MGLPLFRKRISGTSAVQDLGYTPTDGDEVEDLYQLLAYVKESVPGVQAVASGAIASDYQRLRVENVCSRLNLVSLAYLWHQPQRLLMRCAGCGGRVCWGAGVWEGACVGACVGVRVCRGMGLGGVWAWMACGFGWCVGVYLPMRRACVKECAQGSDEVGWAVTDTDIDADADTDTLAGVWWRAGWKPSWLRWPA